MKLTHERLREVLSYDADNGIFIWCVGIGGKAKRGKRAGAVVANGYRRIGIDCAYYEEHRLAWFYIYGRWPANQIDHINAICIDNRITNLREATNSENAQNRRRQKNNTSGFKGVTHHKQTGRWQAAIKRRGKSSFLGLFDTPEEAHKVYAHAAAAAFGKFARTE